MNIPTLIKLAGILGWFIPRGTVLRGMPVNPNAWYNQPVYRAPGRI